MRGLCLLCGFGGVERFGRDGEVLGGIREDATVLLRSDGIGLGCVTGRCVMGR